MLISWLLACTTATDPVPPSVEEPQGPPSVIVVVLGGVDASALADDPTPTPWLAALPAHRETQVSGALPDWGGLATSMQAQGFTTMGLSNDAAVPLGAGFEHVENQTAYTVRDLVNTLRGWDDRVEGPTFTVLAIGDLRAHDPPSADQLLYVDQYVARLGEDQGWGDRRHALVVSDPGPEGAVLWVQAGPDVPTETGSAPTTPQDLIPRMAPLRAD